MLGNADGIPLGLNVGVLVGIVDDDGCMLGLVEGIWLGTDDGSAVLGANDGSCEGLLVTVGATVGVCVGLKLVVGTAVGAVVGEKLGVLDGSTDGELEAHQ